MKYFDSWIPTCLMFGSLFFISLASFLWNPIGVILGFIILIATILSGLFYKKSNSKPLEFSSK